MSAGDGEENRLDSGSGQGKDKRASLGQGVNWSLLARHRMRDMMRRPYYSIVRRVEELCLI